MDPSLDALENQGRFSSTDTSLSACHGLLLVRRPQLSKVLQVKSTNSVTVLDGREAKENLRAGFPTDRRPYTDDYDYESDSDLEDGNDGDHDDDVPDDEPASVPQVVTDKPRKSSVVILGKSEAKGNESSDMVSVSDIESLFTESSETKDEKEPSSSSHVGKVVVIEDVAFIT